MPIFLDFPTFSHERLFDQSTVTYRNLS